MHKQGVRTTVDVAARSLPAEERDDLSVESAALLL